MTTDALPAVEYVCCPECKATATGWYDVLVSCWNCGERHIGHIQRGYHPSAMDKTCPTCGVRGCLQFGTIAEARAVQKEQQKAGQ